MPIFDGISVSLRCEPTRKMLSAYGSHITACVFRVLPYRLEYCSLEVRTLWLLILVPSHDGQEYHLLAVRVLQEQRLIQIEGLFCADMHDFILIMIPQRIKAEAVRARIDQGLQFRPQLMILGIIDGAFKNGVLYPHTV